MLKERHSLMCIDQLRQIYKQEIFMFENIEMLFKMKKAWSTFSSNHPGVAGFFGQIGRRGIGEGAVLDMKVTYPDGTHMETNMRVTQSDLELVQMLRELAAKQQKK